VPLSDLELNFSKVFPKEILEVLDESKVLQLRMQSDQQSGAKKQSGNALFPANMFLEGFDQHSRWFLSSMVLSMALTDQAPFKTLKTHGILVDQAGEKISKSAPLFEQT